MVLVKKLIFGPIFILIFVLTIYQLSFFLKSYDLIFSLSITTLIQLIIISGFILLSSLSFVLFSIFSLDWRYLLPLGILSSLVPFLFLTPALGVVLMVGIIVSLLLTYLGLESTMKSYLTFQPATLLGSSIKQLTSLLILVICIVYFFSINMIVQQNGFQIPDSLIDAALKFASPPQTGSIQQTLNPLQDVLKQTIKDQLQNLLKPYLGFVPAVLAVILFLTLQSLTSILNLLIYPLIWILFYILEKTGFIKFIIEQRPVKKMAV